MKKIKLVIIICLLTISGTIFAQPGSGRPPHSKEKSEKFEAMKVAFFTQRLSFTVEEAKVFWPVYDQYQSELKELRDKRWSEIKKYSKSGGDLSDKEYEVIADSEIEFRQNELNIIKKYHTELKTVIPSKKLAQLYKAEKDFKRELLRQIQDKNQKGGNRPPSNKRKPD